MLPQSHPKNAFTLLELLVVVAVIALLLAILLPGLSAAMEAGRAAVCGNNLNQLFHGSFVYMEENDQRLPWYGWAHYRPAGQEWWVTQIAQSMDQFEPGIYRCPSDPLPLYVPVYLYNGTMYMQDGRQGPPGASGWLRAGGRPRDSRPITLDVSYRGSCNLYYEIGGPNSGRGYAPYRATSFTHPAAIIQMVEGVFGDQIEIDSMNQKDCFRFSSMKRLATKTGQKYNASFGRHFGTGNVCFLDGHISNEIPIDQGAIAGVWRSYLTPHARKVNKFN